MKILQLIGIVFLCMILQSVYASDYDYDDDYDYDAKQYVQDCFLLGLNPDDDFYTQDINRAYRKLSLKYHPDKYNEFCQAYLDGYSKEDCEAKFKKISNAKNRLIAYKDGTLFLSLDRRDDSLWNCFTGCFS